MILSLKIGFVMLLNTLFRFHKSPLQRSGIDVTRGTTGGTIGMEPDTNGVRGIPKQNTASFLSSDTVYFRGFKGRIRNEIALTPLDSSAITHEYRTNALLRILKGASGTNVWMKHGTDTASTNQAFMSLMLPCLQPTKEQVVRKDYPAVVTHVSWATPEEAGSDAHINGKQVQNLVICDDLPTGSYLCVGNKVYGVNALKQAFQPHGIVKDR